MPLAPTALVVESAGRDPAAVAALIEFAELMAIPVIEGRAAAYANFPKSHPLHLGTNVAAVHQETDLALLVESRVPWYPRATRRRTRRSSRSAKIH